LTYLRGLEIPELTEDDMPVLRASSPNWFVGVC